MTRSCGLGNDLTFGQPFAINDYCTSLRGAFGLGLGLLHRLRTGGVRVETSLGHTATFLQLPYMQTFEGKIRDAPSGPQACDWVRSSICMAPSPPADHAQHVCA
jgi:crotonobetainyl-CoA:carnitine CoA-transferase CaiB-like acyl-CoA transferase